MNEEIIQRLTAQDAKIDLIAKDVRSIKRIFLISFILSVVFLVLPLLGLVFAIPMLMDSLNSLYSVGL